jgi:hypothetical protein
MVELDGAERWSVLSKMNINGSGTVPVLSLFGMDQNGAQWIKKSLTWVAINLEGQKANTLWLLS